MKTTTHSGNGCSESCVYESTVLCRPRYFPRQLITPEEMILEAQYFRDKLRHHNRLMHGWGVVCGAGVCRAPKSDQPESQRAKTGAEYEPWKVLVKPGYILGPCGDEIIIECNQIVDLRKPGMTSVSGEPCPEEVDFWCSDPATTPHVRTLCVAVKYKQIMTRPVRVQPVGCGCDDMPCEYSRWCDGYEIGILSDCSECSDSPQVPTLEELTKGILPDCPECPTSPWVCLAKLTVDESGGITDLKNCVCRRLVVSFSKSWWKCSGDPCCDVDSPQPAPVTKPVPPPPVSPSPASPPPLVKKSPSPQSKTKKRRRKAPK
jgi:hypothetical protein